MTRAAIIAAITLIAGPLFVGSAAADEAAVQAAMAACSTGDQSAQNKYQCELSVMAMKKSMEAAAAKKSATVQVDFNDSDDNAAQKAAKTALFSAMAKCDEANSGGQLTQCHMDAFDTYQGSMQ